jgi:hypothetical protein
VGIVLSLILVGAGAICVWAVTGDVTGVDLDVLGVILMIVGVICLFVTFFLRGSWWGPGRTRRTYLDDPPPGGPPPP